MRVQFNDGQEILDSDLNDVVKLAEKSRFEKLVYYLTNRDQNAFFQDSFFVDYVDATHVSVRAGLGVQTDNTQTGTETTKRQIWASAATSKTLAAADPTNPRIDTICVKSTRVTTTSQTRNVKDYTTQNVLAQTLVTQTDWSADIVVVTGTPAGSPAAPAPTAGYIQLATVLVSASTGVANQAAITDSRVLLSTGDQIKIDTSVFVGVSTRATNTILKTVLSQLDSKVGKNSYGYDAVVGSGLGCTHATLALALADAAVVAGSRILMTSNETWNASNTVSKANMQIEAKPGVTITNGTAGTGLTIAANGVRVRGLRFSGFTTAISISDTFPNYFVTECRFATCTNEVTDNNATPNGVQLGNISE